jgi:hypothetical protein
MKKNVLVFTLIGCLVLLAGCITVVVPTAAPAPTQVPSSIPPTATQVPPSPTLIPTATPEPFPPPETPTATTQPLKSAVVGFPPNGFVLYYDPAKWEAKPSQYNASAWILESREFNDCEIRQLLGHGVDPNQTPLTTEVLNFSGIEITYNLWRDKDTHFPAIVGYYWDNFNGSAEVFVEDQPEECLAAAQQVIKDSAAYGFAD